MDELLIAARIPEFENKPSSWFRANTHNIDKGRVQHDFWARNTLRLSKRWPHGLSTLAEKLIDLGYEAVSWPNNKGEFSIRGGAIIISPINDHTLWHVEFFGQLIDRIAKLSEATPSNRERKRSLHEYLRDGDYIVHEDHGVGIWRGITEERGTKYFLIEYRGPKHGSPDTLMVPLTEEKRVTPYIGFRVPPVTRLGTPLWGRTVKQTKEETIVFARKLLELYASRETIKRPPLKPVPELEESVQTGFPFEETPSQRTALRDIWHDFSSDIPMDRVLMGDVGFGKTEIALRAAVRAAGNGLQVAVLAPTTLLCDQHYQVWSQRLAALPLSVARLSRLESGMEEKKILKDIKEGRADIVIGTHRILSKDVSWKRLGFLIIDEEQRFGVRAKEYLKELKKDVDILTLSATPLPRTFSLSVSGVKHMSTLEEPPDGRRATQTIVLPFQKKIVESALNQELSRKGQIYVLESRIRAIPKTMELLSSMISPSRIGYIHGQMSEKQLVETMEKFREKKIEILISTTIIENGIDLADVNTLVVMDSTLFGLSEMHQLRGRVGRGSAEAFAYFLYNPKKLKDKARERLDILASMQFLGSGRFIAEKDMEMRGAGNILGKEQSGVARAVGLNLYSQFLAEAVEKLRRTI
ncbi:MAG: DEAD/DEAH box helicase [Patescibacteria group bacterium]